VLPAVQVDQAIAAITGLAEAASLADVLATLAIG